MSIIRIYIYKFVITNSNFRQPVLWNDAFKKVVFYNINDLETHIVICYVVGYKVIVKIRITTYNASYSNITINIEYDWANIPQIEEFLDICTTKDRGVT